VIISTAYIGTEYTPGEVLPDSLPEDFVKRLIASGAAKEEPEAQKPARPAPAPEPEKPEEAETPEEAEEPEEAAEPEAPEVDVSAALVEDAPKPEKPAKKKGARAK